MAEIVPYEISEKKLVWAQRRVKAMRGALREIPSALTGLSRASSAMEKAAKAAKSQQESGIMSSFVTSIEGLRKTLSEFNDDWTNDTDAIWLGVMEYQSGGRDNERSDSGLDDRGKEREGVGGAEPGA